MKNGAGKLAPRLIVGVAGLVIVAALGMELIATRGALADARREAATLREWQSAILVQLKNAQRPAKGAGFGSRLSPADATEALADLVAQRDTATEVMRLSSADRSADPAVSGTAPPIGAAAPNSITRLRDRESSGIAGQDVTAIEDDSKAAWSGWK